MMENEVNDFYKCKYIETCNVCGLDQEILSQDGLFHMNSTRVYVMHTCGNYIEFLLPVN